MNEFRWSITGTTEESLGSHVLCMSCCGISKIPNTMVNRHLAYEWLMSNCARSVLTVAFVSAYKNLLAHAAGQVLSLDDRLAPHAGRIFVSLTAAKRELGASRKALMTVLS